MNYLSDSKKIITDILSEVGTSTVKINKSKKRAALAGKSAINICKEANPGLYKKYKKKKDEYMKLKKQILKQYKSKALAMAKKKIK